MSQREIGIKEKKEHLYQLCKKEKEQYLAVLQHLGMLTHPYLQKEYRKEEPIHIDKTGFSPQLSRELGELYLGNRFIIVSPNQKTASVMNPALSCTYLVIDAFFEKSSSLIEKMLMHEPILGNIRIGLKYVARTKEPVRVSSGDNKGDNEQQENSKLRELDFFQYFRHPNLLMNNEAGTEKSFVMEKSFLENCVVIHSKIDTPTHMLRKLRKSILSENMLRKELSLVLRQDYLQRLHNEIRQLEKIVGDTRNYSSENIATTITPDRRGVIKAFLQEKANQQEIYEIYFVNGIKPSVFYFAYARHRHETDVKTRVCSALPENILNSLIQNNHVVLDTELARKRIMEVENDVLAKHGFYLIRTRQDAKLGKRLVKRELGNIERLALLTQHPAWIKELDPEWDSLEKILSRADLKLLSPNLKFQFAKIREGSENDASNDASTTLIREMMARINPFDYVASQKYDEKGFMEKFQKADEDTSRMIISKLTVLGESEKNMGVQIWLEKNYPKLVADVREALK
jgi:hypothetical protein